MNVFGNIWSVVSYTKSIVLYKLIVLRYASVFADPGLHNFLAPRNNIKSFSRVITIVFTYDELFKLIIPKQKHTTLVESSSSPYFNEVDSQSSCQAPAVRGCNTKSFAEGQTKLNLSKGMRSFREWRYSVAIGRGSLLRVT